MQSDIYNRKEWVDRFIYSKPPDAYEEDRISRIFGMMPSDVKSVLDVGIGGGYIYQKLRGKGGLAAFGVDVSYEMARRSSDGHLCVADAAKLPFGDKEFDLVLAADLIEHLSESKLDDAILELARVAKKYIVISSPYMDAIKWPVALCDRCNNEFNIYGHLRSVNIRFLKSLFPDKDFEISRHEVFGLIRHMRPLFLVRLARKYGKVYSPQPAVCPNCFNDSIVPPSRNAAESFLGKAVYGIFNFIHFVTPPMFRIGSKVCVLIRKRT